MGIRCFICHYLSLSIIVYHYLSLSIIVYHYLSLSVIIYHYRSLSIIIYHYLSLSITIYSYLSLSFIIYHCLSLSIVIYHYFHYLSVCLFVCLFVCLSVYLFYNPIIQCLSSVLKSCDYVDLHSPNWSLPRGMWSFIAMAGISGFTTWPCGDGCSSHVRPLRCGLWSWFEGGVALIPAHSHHFPWKLQSVDRVFGGIPRISLFWDKARCCKTKELDLVNGWIDEQQIRCSSQSESDVNLNLEMVNSYVILTIRYHWI